MADAKPGIEGLLTEAVAERHSPLYIAMRDSHDPMVRAFENKRPDWSALVAGFNDLGILDGQGKPPTIRCAQNTWARVKKDVQSARGRTAARRTAGRGVPPSAPSLPVRRGGLIPEPIPAITAPAPVLPPRYPTDVQPVRQAPAFNSLEGADDAPVRPTFAPAKLRD